MGENYKDLLEKHAKKGDKLTVELDSKQMRDLMEENIRLKEQRDDYRHKAGLIATIEFERRKKELNAPESIKTVEELREWEAEHGDVDDSGTEDNVGSGSAGSVSLSDNQQIKPKKVFNSQKEMIDHLTEREAQGDKEAGQILDKLTEKWMKSAQRQHDGQHLVLADAEKAYENEGIISVMQEREREKIKVKKNARK